MSAESQENRSNLIRIDVPDDIESSRIDSYLGGQESLKLSRTKIQYLVEHGQVTVNGKPVASSHLVKGGESIEVNLPEPRKIHIAPEEIAISIPYEDEHLAVVDKPAGMLTHPSYGVKTGTMVNALLHRLGKLPAHAWAERPGIVHRLDKGTSGLLVVAKTDEVMLKLQISLKAREIHRTYLALVCGHMAEDGGNHRFGDRSIHPRPHQDGGGRRRRP